MWESRLFAELKALGSKFHGNELAYLSLTSKSEHAVRDRLAFSLHQKYHPSGFKVAREWSNRIDLAILNPDQKPCCLVELKSILAFDVINTSRRSVLPSLLDEDKKKLDAAREKHVAGQPECFQLLLLSRAIDLPNTDQDQYIKYGARIRRDPATSDREIVEKVREKCGNGKHGVWSAGRAYEISANVHFWLFNRSAA